MRILTFFFTLASALAQIEQPGLGLMPDQNGAARPVLGLAGAVTLGDAIVNGVQALGCSKQWCLPELLWPRHLPQANRAL